MNFYSFRVFFWRQDGFKRQNIARRIRSYEKKCPSPPRANISFLKISLSRHWIKTISVQVKDTRDDTQWHTRWHAMTKVKNNEGIQSQKDFPFFATKLTRSSSIFMQFSTFSTKFSLDWSSSSFLFSTGKIHFLEIISHRPLFESRDFSSSLSRSIALKLGEKEKTKREK